MNKLFNLTQAKGKWHKFPSFNLGGGAKLYKNFAQKLLAVSLCMAMVLLGVPRGQNFVAEAADEATKSVALLTLTLIGEGDVKGEIAEDIRPGEGDVKGEIEDIRPGEGVVKDDFKAPIDHVKGDSIMAPIDPGEGVELASAVAAAMEWKSFVPGTTVGLEVVFVDAEGNASVPRDYGTWLDTYGSMEPSDAGFATFAPPAWLEALPSGTQIHGLFGALWHPDLLRSVRLFLGTRDWFAPLPLGIGGQAVLGVYAGSPGVARLAVGSSLDLLSHPALALLRSSFPKDTVFDWTLSADGLDASVASFDSASALLAGVAAGSAACTLSLAGGITKPGQPPEELRPRALGTLDVEVYAPTVAGVTLDVSSKTLAEGESFDLTAKISPENATNKNVTWTSSDEAVASVSGDGLTGTVKALKAGQTTITVTTADGSKTARCEVTVTEAGGPPADTPDASAYLEATVTLKGHQQRIRVYDPNEVLPEETELTAEYVDDAHGDHNFFVTHTDPTKDVELQHFYNLTLTSGGKTLSQLDGQVELWFEAIDGIDAADSFISRVSEGEDAKLDPMLYTDENGVTWIKVLTDHFSPYALTDLLSKEEKAALAPSGGAPKHNVATGDLATQIAEGGLGMTLVLALGIMLRLVTNKREFEE